MAPPVGGDDILTMDYEELIAESGYLRTWAKKFEGDMEDSAAKVAGMTWEGGSGSMFKPKFDEANRRLDTVKQAIFDIALLLERCADGIDGADKALASQLEQAW